MNSPKLVQQLEIFFQVCIQTDSFQKFQEIYKYISINGLLPLLETIEKIRTDPNDPTEALKTLQIPETQIEIVKNIVFKTVEAACLGLISKSKEKPEFEKALNYIIGIIEAGNYWSVVAHSMAEFEIQCDDKTVNRTFFEQKILELV